jgi:hypothetical protein
VVQLEQVALRHQRAAQVALRHLQELHLLLVAAAELQFRAWQQAQQLERRLLAEMLELTELYLVLAERAQLEQLVALTSNTGYKERS